jgi:haloalkane dehalogenase
MATQRILLTTPTYPYPTLPGNESLTDATGQRFTKGDDIFTLISHTHCYANHILAQNINQPVVLLEYPRWHNFSQEVDKGYDIIGITAYPVHLEAVMKMCRYVRKNSPRTKILLGSYGGQAFSAKYEPEIQKQYVDHVVHGEGVGFLREFIGEANDRPIQQRLMPKAGSAPWFVNQYPIGNVGFLVSGLGCPGGCDFCATTALFDFKRIELLSPEELVEHIHLYHQYFPEVRQVFVIEEDHFRHPEYLFKTKEYWQRHPAVLESLDWLAFGSIDHIAGFAEQYGWDTVAEIGIGAIFIGVESKFAGAHGYSKRESFDAKMVFDKLHTMGIRTLGAWVCGWDFHDHSNIYEDLNYFVACYPTYQQLTRLSPFPGTLLYNNLMEDGRVKDVPWEDVHFWSGAQQNISLETHETLNLVEYGYRLMYNTWGASMLRKLDIMLNGYQYCLASSNPALHDHKSEFFRRHCALLWTLLGAMDRFAPNGVVRRRVRKIDEKYKNLIGKPTPVMKLMSRVCERLAIVFKKKDRLDPFNRYPKEEPFKRYLYDNRQSDRDDAVAYRTEFPNSTPARVRMAMKWNDLRFSLMAQWMKGVQKCRPSKGDADIDNYLIKTIREKNFIGF